MSNRIGNFFYHAGKSKFTQFFCIAGINLLFTYPTWHWILADVLIVILAVSNYAQGIDRGEEIADKYLPESIKELKRQLREEDSK